MGKAKVSIDDLLASMTRDELRSRVAVSRLPISLIEAGKLIDRAQAMEPRALPFRLAIVHSYTSELMDPWLSFAAALQGLDLYTWHAPYGMVVQQAQEDSALVRHQPDMTLLMLQREDLHPALAKPLGGGSPGELDALRVDVLGRLRAVVDQFRRHNVGQIVLTILPAMQAPGAGLYDAQSERSENGWWARLKSDIARYLREEVQSTLLLDLDDVLREVGRSSFFDYRLWYSARFPFAPDAIRELARRVVALAAVMRLPKAKVIVLDADNTLWGGIIGESGMDGIALGPDYPGNTFVAFQRRLLDFQQRGFVLALCSKNNAADLDQVLREHPHQLLRDQHFAARRVNWIPKPDNLLSLSEELNLGLDSFIFVDDSDHECAAVRQCLPQVEVVQTPSRPIDIPSCLEHVARLEVLSLTAEDLVKTAMYAQERRRRELKDRVDGTGMAAGNYLASLEMKMYVSFNNSAHVARLSQMTQKTNQFNLTTRRYGEQQMQDFIFAADCIVADFALEDVFGHSGIVGLAVFRLVGNLCADLDTFLMSCRAIGREAESAFLHCLLRQLADQGIRDVVADYLPTPKNELAKSFLPDQGFDLLAGGRYGWSFAHKSPKPECAFPIVVTVHI